MNALAYPVIVSLVIFGLTSPSNPPTSGAGSPSKFTPAEISQTASTFGFFEPDWQIHAKWCAKDGGSSGSKYRQTCRTYDQFDSVIECQKDAGNGDAVAAVQAAGRATVNAFMDSYKPKECK